MPKNDLALGYGRREGGQGAAAPPGWTEGSVIGVNLYL